MSRFQNMLRTILFLALTAVITVSCVVAAKKIKVYFDGKKAYADIQNRMITYAEESSGAGSGESGNGSGTIMSAEGVLSNSSAVADTSSETAASSDPASSGAAATGGGTAAPALKINWSAADDPGHTVGWLTLGTISYPIMQGTDNTYYLHHLPDGTKNYDGSIFLSSEDDASFTDDNSFIYGHNMADGTMFGSLKKYANEEHKDDFFYIYLPDGTAHAYRFFAVITVREGDRAYNHLFPSKKDFLAYQKYLQSISIVKCGLKPDADARLVSLSTCNGVEGTNRRLVIIGIEED